MAITLLIKIIIGSSFTAVGTTVTALGIAYQEQVKEFFGITTDQVVDENVNQEVLVVENSSDGKVAESGLQEIVSQNTSDTVVQSITEMTDLNDSEDAAPTEENIDGTVESEASSGPAGNLQQ